MPKVLRQSATMIALCGFAVQVSATVLELETVADAFVCSGDWANNNYGDRWFSPRAVGRQNEFTGQQIGRQLYKFVLPVGVTSITIAELRLKTFDNFAGFPAATAVYGAGDNWDEMAVTWNNQPLQDSGLLDTVDASCCGIVYYYDVTSYVQDQFAAGDRTISFMQRAPDESIIGGVRWFQREGDGLTHLVGECPRLLITPIPEPTTLSLLALGGFWLMRQRRM